MKKFLCFMVVFTICVASVCFAGTSLSDVAGTKYEDAVSRLTNLEIINGYEDGTFRPSACVTRAQLAKIMVIALGKEGEVEAAKQKYLKFTDVLSSHWAYGYIKVASDAGMINGYPDGTFKPDGNVTYAEATAMMIRALEFEEAVNQQTDLYWPNNYLSYADDKLDLFEDMTEFKATAPANRGDIAIMMWNTLRTGIADIVATNDKGLVYGEGTAMITRYFNYVYLEDAEVIEIEFDDDLKNATVTLKEENKSQKEYKFSAEDALDMFGKEVTLLYDNKNKEMIEVDYESDYKTVNVKVTNVSITSSTKNSLTGKLYVSNKSTGYNLPDDYDNILFYGIDDLEDTVDAILLLSGSNIKYMVAMGASEADVGIVVNIKTLVGDSSDKNYGIKIRNIDESKGGSSYMLADEENWPSNGDVYIYYIDSDDLFVPIKKINSNKSVKLEGIYKKYIETEDDEKYEFDSEDDYTVVFVGSSKLVSKELSDIEIKKDKIFVYEYNAHLYFFIYEDALEDEVDDEIEGALNDLEFAIDDALDLDEADYTQESYAKLMEKVANGQKMDYTYTLAKIEKATEKIEDAIDNLEEVSGSSEKKIVKAKKALRELVKDVEEDYIDDYDDYTEETYDALEEAYDDAVEILEMTDATYSEIDDAYETLEDAIDGLEEE